MQKLEQTIIENARSALTTIFSFYNLKQNGQATTDNEYEEYLKACLNYENCSYLFAC